MSDIRCRCCDLKVCTCSPNSFRSTCCKKSCNFKQEKTNNCKRGSCEHNDGFCKCQIQYYSKSSLKCECENCGCKESFKPSCCKCFSQNGKECKSTNDGKKCGCEGCNEVCQHHKYCYNNCSCKVCSYKGDASRPCKCSCDNLV